MPPISVDFWCSGCGQYINKDQVRTLEQVGRMCKLCGSGRVVPVVREETNTSTGTPITEDGS